MGYYTRYKLETDPTEVLGAALEVAPDPLKWAVGDDGNSGDSCKWYDHEQDMRAISLKFPDVTFKLYGDGEEQGDLWHKYFRNGKMQECRAVVTIPPLRKDGWK